MAHPTREWSSLAGLLGVAPGPIRWERPLLWLGAFFCGIFGCKTYYLLWYWIMPNPFGFDEFYARCRTGLPSFGGELNFWFFLQNILLIVLAMLFFRKIAQPVLAALITALVFLPVKVGWSVIEDIRCEQDLLKILTDILWPLVFTFLFLAGLALALRLLRPLWVALMAGLVASWIVYEVLYILINNLREGGLTYILPRLFNTFANSAPALMEILCWASSFSLLWLISRESVRPAAGSPPRLRRGFYLGTMAGAYVTFISYNLWISFPILEYFLRPQYVSVLARSGPVTALAPGAIEHSSRAIGFWEKLSDSGRILEGLFSSPGFLLMEGLLCVLLIYAAVVFFVFIYKAWAALQDGQARITPAQAVGFLFIPIFNLFWGFRVFAGYAREYNTYLQRHGIDAPRLSPALGVAYMVLGILSMIPVVGILPAVVNYFIVLFMVARYADAVNVLPEPGSAGVAAVAPAN